MCGISIDFPVRKQIWSPIYASGFFVGKLVAPKKKEKPTNDSGEGRGQGYGTRGGLFHGSHQDEGHAGSMENMAKWWLRLGQEVP